MRLLLAAAAILTLTACGGDPEPVDSASDEVAVASSEAVTPVEAADAPRREITDEASAEEADDATAAAEVAREAGSTDIRSAGAEPSCREQVGEAAAQALVDVCLNVSPATRPPCNADNACSLIESEIQRGCNLLGEEAPADCPRM